MVGYPAYPLAYAMRCPDIIDLEGFKNNGFVALHDVARVQRMTRQAGDFFRRMWRFNGDRGRLPAEISNITNDDIKHTAMEVSQPALVRLWQGCRALGPKVNLSDYDAVVRLLQKHGAAFQMPFADKSTGGIGYLIELAKARKRIISADRLFRELWEEVGVPGKMPDAIKRVKPRDIMWAHERGMDLYAQAYLRLNSAAWALFDSWCTYNDRPSMTGFEIQTWEIMERAFRRMGIED